MSYDRNPNSGYTLPMMSIVEIPEQHFSEGEDGLTGSRP